MAIRNSVSAFQREPRFSASVPLPRVCPAIHNGERCPTEYGDAALMQRHLYRSHSWSLQDIARLVRETGTFNSDKEEEVCMDEEVKLTCPVILAGDVPCGTQYDRERMAQHLRAQHGWSLAEIEKFLGQSSE